MILSTALFLAFVAHLGSSSQAVNIKGLKGSENYKLVDITASDGIVLEAIYFDPVTPMNETGNPAILFISSWGMNKWEYVVPANEYYEKGYSIISYTARGFWGSGGEIDLAGPKDMADLSTVMDWLLANTHADPKRVGLSGISYGGGISMLGAALDPRVKSIAAMSCWVDLAESFLGNGETIRVEAVKALQVLAEVTGQPSDDLETIFTDYFSNSNLEFLYEFTAQSSAVNYIESIKTNGAAIFIANALGDSLFTPNQFPSFFNELTNPKHIEFAPGDHAGPELPGLLSLPNQVWSRASEWNDYYLLHGLSGEFTGMPQVIYNTMNGKEIEEYNSLAEVSTESLVFDFDKRESLNLRRSSSPLSPLNISSSASSLSTFKTGKDANINGGIAYLSLTLQAYTDIQKPFAMWRIDRTYGAVFESDRFGKSYKFRGIPTLSLSIQPEASNGTLVIYFLSVDNLNKGHLFDFSPWTFKDAAPGKPLSLTIEMTMTSYDMPAEHRLAVVVASHDRLYMDQSPKDKTISVLSGCLSLPISNKE